MARKTIEGDQIHTTNGVDTLTAAVYVRELRTFEPLPNGFNRDLATYVVDWIEANQALWDQHSWRVLFELDKEEIEYRDRVWLDRKAKDKANPQELDSIQAALTRLAKNVDATENPTCGTAMCLAGWVGELTGADWVIDRKILTQSKTILSESLRQRMAEMVVVPGRTRQHGEEVDYWYEQVQVGRVNDKLLNQHLASRGFTPQTHHMVHVKDYAAMQLGISKNTITAMPVLFEGTNTIEDLRAVIDWHTEHGPVDTIDLETLPSYQPGGINDGEDDDD